MKRNPSDLIFLGAAALLGAAQLYHISTTKKRVKTFGLLPFWVTYLFWMVFVVVPMVGLVLLTLFSSR